MIATAEYRK
jgi:hypothetical protein